MAMAEKGGVRKEEIEKVIIEELPRLMAESPAFRHQLMGIVWTNMKRGWNLLLVDLVQGGG